MARAARASELAAAGRRAEAIRELEHGLALAGLAGDDALAARMRADLESHHAVVTEPLSLEIGAGTLYNMPPPTQGLASLLILGAAVGSTLLVAAPDWVVTLGVVAMFGATLIAERYELRLARAGFAPLLSFASGATSGFSGTSGPLKGVAIRNLDLDRRHFVGAASLASFAGDATKTAIFAEAELLGRQSVLLALAAVPLMALGTWTGSTFNNRSGERRFAMLFWTVMTGYTVRLGFLLA